MSNSTVRSRTIARGMELPMICMAVGIDTSKAFGKALNSTCIGTNQVASRESGL
jgi:hypothetical protein